MLIGLPQPIHVLIADSARLRSQLIATALGRRTQFKVSQCQLDFKSILEAMRAEPVDVVLAETEEDQDIGHELEQLRRVHAEDPQVRLVLLASSYGAELVLKAFRAGVRGLFCFTEGDFRMLCRCLQCVHRGQIWANTEQVGILAESVRKSPALRVTSVNGNDLLTPREQEVVALVADGLTNRQAAMRLQVTENTVKKYLFHIFEKLGISSRVELVLYAMQGGMRETPAAG